VVYNSGIYRIINLINGNFYIGSAKNLKIRKKLHFNRLRKGNHDNRHLQYAYNSYGENNFRFEILIYCDMCNLLLYEQQCIDKFNPEYNIRKIATSNLGLKHTAEAKSKISKSALGNKYSVGNKWMLGRKLPQSTIDKLIRFGKENPFYGKHHSEETKKEISLKNKGKSRNVGETNPNSKLSTIEVSDIIVLKNFGVSSKTLSKAYSVSVTCIDTRTRNKK